MFKSRKKWFAVAAILVIVMMCMNTIFLKSLLRINHFNADNADGSVSSQLVYGFSGYEMIISGDGEMSEYTPNDWNSLKSLSAGWKVPIKKVTVKEGVISVSAGLFSGCSKLKSVTLPRSLSKIGVKAFAYCYSLEKIEYGGTMGDWEVVAENSPGWSDESVLECVVCTDGIYEIS